jgi:hypothetical protein
MSQTINAVLPHHIRDGIWVWSAERFILVLCFPPCETETLLQTEGWDSVLLL